ncbi:MAG: transposase DNA-binding-containing protein, partial [Spirulinaceae cyanobacterium]
MNWVHEELKHADLGDVRRNKRLIKIVEDLSSQPNASVTKAVRDNAAM